MKGTRPLDNNEIRKVSVSGDFRMRVKYLFSTGAILFLTLTFFVITLTLFFAWGREINRRK